MQATSNKWIYVRYKVDIMPTHNSTIALVKFIWPSCTNVIFIISTVILSRRTAGRSNSLLQCPSWCFLYVQVVYFKSIPCISNQWTTRSGSQTISNTMIVVQTTAANMGVVEIKPKFASGTIDIEAPTPISKTTMASRCTRVRESRCIGSQLNTINCDTNAAFYWGN